MRLPLLQAKLLLQLEAAAGNRGRKAEIQSPVLLRIPPMLRRGHMHPAADLDLPFGCFKASRYRDEGGVWCIWGSFSNTVCNSMTSLGIKSICLVFP